MARPRKLIDASTGNLTKAEIAKRRKEETALKNFEEFPAVPPKWMSEVAKAEYHRVAPLLNALPIAALDLASVVMYCDYYSIYIAASQRVDKEGLTIVEIDSQGNDKKKVNPEFTAMNDAARLLRSLAGNLGMTIDSRMRIVVPKVEKPIDPFAELLKEF